MHIQQMQNLMDSITFRSLGYVMNVQCAVMYSGIWDSFEVYKCDLEGRAQQPTGRAVRGLHSEEVEERYATVHCCFCCSQR